MVFQNTRASLPRYIYSALQISKPDITKLSSLFYQTGMRVMQVIREQASKGDSTLKSLKESSSSSSSSSSKQARRFSSAADSTAFNSYRSEKLRQAEESLRTVMYLSCWGPN